MSVQFETWVIPEASRFDMLPSPGNSGQIVELLAREGWTDPTAPCEFRDLDTYADLQVVAYHSVGQVCDELAAQSTAFSVDLWSAPWPAPGKAIEDLDAAADFSKAEDLVLLPTHGVAVKLVLAPTLRLLPGDMNGSSIPCAACGEDIMDVEYERMGLVAFPAPTSCPHCGAGLAHRDLVGQTTLSGDEIVEEEAPFFRFALCLEPAQKPTVQGFVTVDPLLTESLHEITRVAFRSMDRWR